MKRLHFLIILTALSLLFSACTKPDPEAALHRAAGQGKLEEMKALLDGGEDVNKVFEGETALLSAARRQKSEALAFLIERGAKLDVKDSKGRDAWELTYPGHGTFMSGPEASSLAVLVQHGFHERLSLPEAASKGNSAVLIKNLVDKGADVKATNEFGWTALHLAAFHGREESCVALLEAGADVNAESTKEFSKSILNSEGTSSYVYRYGAGSRPLDVAQYGGTKGTKSTVGVIQESGGTNNPMLDNIRGK